MSAESLRERLERVENPPILFGQFVRRDGSTTETVVDIDQRREDRADLDAHAVTDLRLALDVIEAALKLARSCGTSIAGYDQCYNTGALNELEEATGAFQAAP